MTEQELTKTCTKCKVSKPHSEFYRSSTYKDGRQLTCKSCDKLRAKETADNNKQYRETHKAEVSTIVSKICNKCKVDKSLYEFNKNSSAKDGRHWMCRECAKQSNKDIAISNELSYEESKNNLPEYKTCSSCKLEKSRSEFNKNRNSKDGLQVRCQNCCLENYIERRSSIRECNKIYRNTHKDALSEIGKLYYLNNASDINARHREQYECNKTAASARNRAYHKANPWKVIARKAKRRSAKLQATPAWSETELIAELYLEANTRSKTEGITYHVDHIVPLQSNLVCGLHCLANLQIITANENHRKNNRYWPDMP
jgi:hypothetical protein